MLEWIGSFEWPGVGRIFFIIAEFPFLLSEFRYNHRHLQTGIESAWLGPRILTGEAGSCSSAANCFVFNVNDF